MTNSLNFLSFIKEQSEKYNCIYLDEDHKHIKGFWFYGNAGILIQIHSINNEVNFVFKKQDNNNSDFITIGSFSVPFADCENLLMTFFQQYNKEHNCYLDFVNIQDTDFITSNIEQIKNYLKTATIDQPLKLVDYEKFNINIPIDDNIHTLKIGKLAPFGNKTKTDLIGAVLIPTLLNHSDNKHNYVNLIIPSWELKNYPCLAPFIESTVTTNNLNDLIAELKSKDLAFGTMLHYHVLDKELSQKNSQDLRKNSFKKKI